MVTPFSPGSSNHNESIKTDQIPKEKVAYKNTFKNIFQRKMAISIESINLIEKDDEERTILHRACLYQKYEIINNIKAKINSKDVNLLDKYGNSPLILACKLPIKEEAKSRYNIVNILIQKHANIHFIEKCNGWTALHWTCFNGELDSTELLIENGALYCLPCKEGYFPIDLAGQRKFYQVVKYLIEELINMLETIGPFEEFDLERVTPQILKQNTRKPINNNPNEINQSLLNQEEITVNVNNHKETSNQIKTQFDLMTAFPLTVYLRLYINHCLYWACYYQIEGRLINKLIIQFNAHPNFPLYSLTNQTAFHAACSCGNKIAFDLLYYNYQQAYNNYKNPPPISIPAPTNDNIKIISVKELSARISLLKKDTYFRSFSSKYQNYLLEKVNSLVYIHQFKNFKPLEILIDNSENSPLLLAAKYSNDDFIKGLTNQTLHSPIDTHLSKSNKYGISGYFYLKDDDLQYEILSLSKKKLYNIPSVILELNKNSKTLSSINLIMKVCLAEKLKVSLMQNMNKDKVFLLVDIEKDQFCREAENDEIEMKLLDKNLKLPFTNTEKFINSIEPFYSRHYQEVITKMLTTLIDIQMLKNQKVLNTVVYPHRPNVIQKIMNTIILRKLYCPNPLIFLPNYLIESKKRINKEIDLLYRYFGETIAIFYAFMSYVTVYYIFMAVIGLIYAFIYLDKLFTSQDIYPTFALIFIIWDIFFLERWKRKSAEIVHNWGMSTSSLTKNVREDFNGDEYYRELDGPLQKHFIKYYSLKQFLITLPLIILLLVADILVFIYTTEWEDKAADSDNFVYQYLPSIVRSLGLVIISTIYDIIANYFATRENFKYQEVFDNTLIVKIFVFRLIADLTAVVYCVIIQQNIESLKTLLYTNIVIKLLSEIGLKVCLPFAKNWWFTRQYFKQVKANEINQLNIKSNLVEDMEEKEQLSKDNNHIQFVSDNDDQAQVKENQNETKRQSIDRLNQEENKETVPFKPFRRVSVINGKTNKENQNSTKSYEINLNPDLIEVSLLQDDKGNIIYEYADFLMIHTLSSLFAIIIPFAAIIVLILEIVSQNGKLYADLFLYKRGRAKASNGIGLWINIMEIISTLSIVFNCFLYYFYGENFLSPIKVAENTEIDVGNGEKSLFILAVTEHLIILIKYILKWSIDDEPHWVRKDKETLIGYCQMSNKRKELDKQIEINETVQMFDKKYKKKVDKLQSLITIKDEKLIEYEKSLEEFKKELLNRDCVLNQSNQTIKLLLNKPKKLREDDKYQYPRIRHLYLNDGNLLNEHDYILSNEGVDNESIFLSYEDVRNTIDLTFDQVLQNIAKEIILERQIKLTDSALDINTHTILKLYYFMMLKKTFDSIEKEIIVKKYEKCLNNLSYPIVTCTLCLEEEAIHYCEDCSEVFCNQCKEKHSNNKLWKHHQITIFSQIEKKRKYYMGKDDSLSKGITTPSNNLKDEDSFIKMESFSFPQKINKNLGYEHLTQLFTRLHYEYIKKNGILNDNSMKRNTEIQMIVEFFSNLKSQPTESIEMSLSYYISNSAFNLEEIYFINRISFKLFKEYGSRASINNVYSALKILQTSTFEERLLLLLNIIDIYDTRLILKDEVENLFVSLSLQYYKDQYKIKTLIKGIFGNSLYIPMKDLYDTILSNKILTLVFQSIVQYREGKQTINSNDD